MAFERTIFWDSFGLQSLHAGVGRHAFDLFQAMTRAGIAPLVLPSHPKIHEAWWPALAGIKPSRAGWMRLKPLSLWRSSRQLAQLARQPIRGVIHGLSNYNLPHVARRTRSRFRRILTVHDLIPLLMPEQVSTSLQAYLRWQMPRAVAEADAVICVSRWTQQSLEEYFPAARGKSVMIPNGIVALDAQHLGVQRLVPDQERRIRLLTVSRDESYKRLDLIRPILDLLPPTFTWDLVTDPRGKQRLDSLDRRLRIQSGISTEELENLYRAAHLYIHPSLLEGYCLPAAQAVQWRLPVIYVGGSGIDETVGLAGESLTTTASPGTWADTVLECAHHLGEWQNRCKVQERSFLTWDEVAARTLKLYGIFEEKPREAVGEQNS